MTYPTDKQVEAAAYAFHGQNWHHFNSKNKMIARRDMRAAIIAADQAAWETVENAPRDGTRVMICCTTLTGPYIIEGRWCKNNGDAGPVSCWLTIDGGFWTSVAKFRPMPLPPVEGMP